MTKDKLFGVLGVVVLACPLLADAGSSLSGGNDPRHVNGGQILADSAVPEAGTLMLMGGGLLAIGLFRRRR